MPTTDNVRLEAFQYFITTAPTAAAPYIASDLIPLVRDGKTYKIPANSFGGINQLTGDVAAGPGSGVQEATLAVVNEDVGAYTYASIVVNEKGLVTSASSGTPPVAPPVAGNPTGTVGKTAVNGTATTYQRSDATAPLADYVALLDTADQTLSGGANVDCHDLGTVTTGTLTVECGQCPLQFVTNGGAFTMAAPAVDGSTIVLVTNNGSAGAVTFTGFSNGSNTGDAITTTNTAKFSIFVWRINGTAGYRVAAHQ